jgi:uncharacterized membrane protein
MRIVLQASGAAAAAVKNAPYRSDIVGQSVTPTGDLSFNIVSAISNISVMASQGSSSCSTYQQSADHMVSGQLRAHRTIAPAPIAKDLLHAAVAAAVPHILKPLLIEQAPHLN